MTARANKKRGWFVRLAFVCTMLIAITVLYLRSNPAGRAHLDQAEYLLQQIREADTQLNEELLLVRYGMRTNYDALTTDAGVERALLAELRVLVDETSETFGSDFAQTLETFDNVSLEKTNLIEDFKSEYAILRNSQKFLPVLAQELDAQAQAEGLDPELIVHLAAVQRDVLHYALSGDDVTRRAVSDAIDGLDSEPANAPIRALDSWPLFHRHTDTVLRQKEVVDGLLSQIIAMPMHQLNHHELRVAQALLQESERKAALNRFWLFVAAMVFLGYATYEYIRVRRYARDLARFNDTLEERVAERTAELEQAHKRHRMMTDAVPALIANVDKNCRIVQVNRAYAEWFGMARSEIEGKRLPEFMGPERFRLIKERVERVLSGKTTRFELTVPRPNGDIRSMTIHYMPEIRDGVVEGFFSLVLDVTEEIAAAKALEESEERFELAVRGSADGIWDWAVGSDQVYFSDRFRELLGYDADEFPNVFDSFESRLHADDHGRIMNAMHDHLDGKAPYDVEYRMRVKSGSYRWFRARAQAIWNEQGEPTRMAGSITDIHEKKRVEQRIQEQIIEIESSRDRLEEQTAELARQAEELAEARDDAEAATKAKSEFLASMSHEIRTPMNAVIGMAELLLDMELERDQRDYVETIRSSGDALLTLINDILDYSKIEAGKLDLESIDVDLLKLIEETVDLLALKSDEKHLYMVCYLDPTVPQHVLGDPSRLRQILINLVGNAIKFTDFGGVVLRCSQAGREDWIRFTIEDTGVGIPEEARAKLFQSFTQVDASTTRKHGGTGLGLAICRRIVLLMGGDIGVDSTLGEGSTFWFEIPAKRIELLEDDRPLDLGGQRILVAAPDEPGSHYLAEQLKAWGADVIETDDAVTAQDALTQAGGPADMGFVSERLGGAGPEGLINAAGNIPLVLITSARSLLRPCGNWADELNEPLKRTHVQSCIVDNLLNNATNHTIEESPGASDPDAPLAERFPLRILIAEDNPVNQKVALKMLEKLGYTAECANNGMEAVVQIADGDYDLIFMDCQMPEMDGFEATARIRESKHSSNITIVAMTANAMIGDREKCLDAGMDDYISKPIKRDVLQEVLSRWGSQAIESHAS